jgi:hypothetical protein
MAITTSPDESGIELVGVDGSASGGARPTSISNSTISNSFEFEIQVTNTSGTLANFQMNNTNVSSNGATGQHGNLFNFLASGTANMTLNVTGGTYQGKRAGRVRRTGHGLLFFVLIFVPSSLGGPGGGSRRGS